MAESNSVAVKDRIFTGECAELFFNEKHKFVPALLGATIRHEFHIVTMKDNREIWIYRKEGYYDSNGAEELRRIIKQILGDSYRENYAQATIDDITASTYIERMDFHHPEHLIPVQNGMIDLLTPEPYELLKHDPKYYVTGIIPVEYNPKAECPRFNKFLEEILPNITDRIKIQEGFGNSLTSSTEYMIIYMLYGEGYNGKSTLLNVLKDLLGEKNLSNASLAQLAYGRWFTAELYRKLANIYSDIGLKELKHTGMIKILTGEDIAYGEKKFKNPFPFTNYAKPWFSGNVVPYVYDDSDAFHRRWRIIQFNQKFPKGAPQTIPGLIRKLTSQNELSGILNWALEGLKRLRKQKTFSLLKTVEERRKRWKELSDPFSVFLSNCVVPGDFVTKEDLYLSYKEYCLKKGYRVISKSLVGRKMKEMGYGEGSMRKEEKGKQYRSWIGIEVESEFFVEEKEKEG